MLWQEEVVALVESSTSSLVAGTRFVGYLAGRFHPPSFL